LEELAKTESEETHEWNGNGMNHASDLEAASGSKESASISTDKVYAVSDEKSGAYDLSPTSIQAESVQDISSLVKRKKISHPPS
jgi:hypothetical protein